MGKDDGPPGMSSETKTVPVLRSFASVFMHADAVDVALMVLGLVAAIEGYCSTRTAVRNSSRMRARYLRAALRQDMEYFDLKVGSTSDVIAGVSNDSLAVQDALSEKVPNFVTNLTVFLGCYAVGFALLWRLALVGLPSVLLLVVPGFLYGRVLIGLARRIRELGTRPGAIAEQAMSSVRTVYSFVAERSTTARFSAALMESARLGIRQGLAKGVTVGSNGVTFAIYAFNIWYGSRLVLYHGYKGGTFYAVSASIVIGGVTLGSGLSNIKYFAEASAAAERILEVLRRVPKIDSESNTGEELATVAGEVEFRNVEFRYPSRPESLVLASFNLRVLAGHTVALVGSSGSGKSTVIALLERFYDPSAGQVTLDGVDIRRLRLKWLRAQMGLVSQEPALFATSIKENILFGKEDATEEEVVAAAKAANAHDFVSQLSQGYNTQVRAIIKSPKILLLDEATSALDTNSERVVQEALELTSIGRTTIVIAHRLSTIRNADLIAVMHSGEVKELGSHDELIANENGIYTSLIHLQKIKESMDTDEVCAIGSHAEYDENTEKPKLPVTSSFIRLLMLNAPEWKHALMGSISAIVFGGLHPVYAYAMGSMISIYFSTDHEEIKDQTRIYALFFVGLAVLSFLINIAQHYNFGAMGEYLSNRIREQMLSKILTFEIGWFDCDKNSSGAICSQLVNDANAVRSLVGERMSLVIQTVSSVLIASIMSLSMFKKSMQAQSECSKIAVEAISNLRIVTAFSSQDRILRLFDQAQEGLLRESIQHSLFAGVGLSTTMGLLSCLWALTFWYGGILIAEHRITSKALFQTFLILASTGRVMADAVTMTTDLAKGAGVASSVFAILDRETEIDPDNPEGHKLEKIKGEVDIREIDFAYPSRPDVIIFKGFSLSIQPGKSTAIVGKSGSGKSTIIGLVERFYDPFMGVVEIDGRDIKTYNLRALRKHIGLVSQEPTLFEGTIRENIVYGTETASEEEIASATRHANAHDFISSLKDGYDTWCGERGVQLSGGQKQRIAIARAILKNPAILLLDEATSALDSHSEKVVQEALDQLLPGRTSIVVAHRLSTIQNCDMIIVLEKGIIQEMGTHASLMGRGPAGTYFGLVSLQQGCNQHLDFA
ncbi:putative multidrug resistance protein [Dichanthelium oligosanthes]|uniref:Putative multidrug resistance protein n=1 Tax=Dichanthelium oligosanthes TaxID=888268 RepID=A0A1E5VEI9_9POAL|nr:putative multidrug resistance protein [Dichanthelium oligosanthes]